MKVTLSGIALARHDAAVKVLTDHEQTGRPFVLCLRKYGIEVAHGQAGGWLPLEVSLALGLSQEVGLVAVQGPGFVRDAMADATKVPTLILDPDRWQDQVGYLIANAELIISEFTFLSAGVRWELDEAIRLGRQDRTVLVVPPQDSPFTCVDQFRPLDMFIRTIWADELHTVPILGSFMVSDLIARLNSIARLPNARLRSMGRSGLAEHFPTTYVSVEEGLRARLRDRAIERVLSSPDAARDYYDFWDWFRVAQAVGVTLRDGGSKDPRPRRFDLAYAYLMLLQGIAAGVVTLNDDASFLDDEFALKLAESIWTIANEQGDANSPLVLLGAPTFARLGINWGD